jgi:hypothetical protein
MKPLHVGLLVVGAALAGGLAVKMTQAPVPESLPATAPKAAPVDKTKPLPAPDSIPVEKTNPIADSAPAVVYEKPSPSPAPVRPSHPATRKNEAARKVKPARQNEPIQVAEAKPLPGAPLPYEQPVPQQQPEAKPAEPAIPPAAGEQRPPDPEPEPEPPAPPRQATLRTGMTIAVRLLESLSSDHVSAGDNFSGTLAEPLIADGLVIAEKGARVSGRVVDAQRAGRVSGTSLIELALTSVTTADGQRVTISTDPWAKRGENSHVQDAEKIGGGAALGAIIGALAGGGKGAAIGAGIGGGAGAGTVAATRGKPVNVPSETIIRFRLASPVTITERI